MQPSNSLHGNNPVTPALVKTYVLVHGAYHGGWCWTDVATRLRAQGHTVYTPTLTGLGERSHLINTCPTLDTFIQDVAQVFRFQELTDVILVGHSFAGSIVSGLADWMPQRLRHLVYLDAQILQSGQAPADTAPPDVIELYKQRAREWGGTAIPPGPPEAFGITDPAMAAWVKTLLTPHPYRTYFDKLTLNHPVGNGIPATYIACTNPLFPNIASSRELAKNLPGWVYQEIPTAHDAMLLQPAALTQMLLEIG